MRIALCQSAIKYEDKKFNIDAANESVKLASKCGDDMILFPEMSFTGFSMNTDKTKENNGETLAAMADIARKNNIAVGFGWVLDCKEKAKNMYTVLDKNGKILAEYAKIHPFSFAGEDRFFEGGKDICRFEYMGLKIGIAICYDLRFPYVFSADCDLMLVPANWPKSRMDHWLALLKARAIENQFYIAGVNCTGVQTKTEYNGNSCVFDPNGEELVRLENSAGIIRADIDAKRVQSVRQAFPVRQDRINL